VRDVGLRPHRFKAAFSTGETLLPFQRRLIEDVFDCQVLSSYGQMERLVAISECPRGRMHVNSEYGLLEAEPSEGIVSPRLDGSAGGATASVIGTGLHNLGMPLLRYRIGDLVELPDAERPCPCGRTLPTVTRVSGRQSDAVWTPDGRVIAAPFLVFEGIRGVRCGRVVQEAPGQLRILVVPERDFDQNAGAALLDRLRTWFGRAMPLSVEISSERDILSATGEKRRVGRDPRTSNEVSGP
jgi:phenylacetate-CoA ligase